MTRDGTPDDASSEESGRLASLALSLVSGVGPRILTQLLSAFGSPQAVLQQPAAALQEVEGVGPKLAAALTDPDLWPRARQMWQDCADSGIDLLIRSDRQYPRRLAEICDPPAVLYRCGALLPQDELAIAIVGSRRCTAYGRRHAERLSATLSRAGFTIVSGLARGIDAVAHESALTAGGRTIAVLAGGVRDIYPPEHRDLAGEISRQGALLSEMPLDQRPLPGLFPQRNRIISGLCLAVIVIEATQKSGALYTARHALEQGREVFALPGPVDSLASMGCHELIRDGVTLVRHVDDVLQGLGPLPVPAQPTTGVTIHSPRELALNPLESQVLNRITTVPESIDTILAGCGLEASRVLATLTVLEMRRLIRRLPGNLFVRCD
jgi:DNA processing protein